MAFRLNVRVVKCPGAAAVFGQLTASKRPLARWLSANWPRTMWLSFYKTTCTSLGWMPFLSASRHFGAVASPNFASELRHFVPINLGEWSFVGLTLTIACHGNGVAYNLQVYWKCRRVEMVCLRKVTFSEVTALKCRAAKWRYTAPRNA